MHYKGEERLGLKSTEQKCTNNAIGVTGLGRGPFLSGARGGRPVAPPYGPALLPVQNYIATKSNLQSKHTAVLLDN